MLHLSWRHDKRFEVTELFDNMIHFLTSWRTFGRNVELYDVMVCCYELFEVMMELLTSWRTSWHHDELFDIMTCLWHYSEFMMWQAIDVMTCVALIDVIMILLTPGTFWQHDAFCWHSDTLIDLMTNLFTTFLSFLLWVFIISGTKYN